MVKKKSEHSVYYYFFESSKSRGIDEADFNWI